MDASTVRENVRVLAQRFAAERHDRQRRRELDPADFAALADAGYLLSGVPAAKGGLFESVRASTRPVAEILRELAHGDSSVALVASMHPAVIAFWLASPSTSGDGQAWTNQVDRITASALDGAWWGTITSEPGSGGDVFKTRASAKRSGEDGWLITGQKHFGSGSGVTSFMITTALPEGEAEPDLFYFDMRGLPWDGSQGVKLTAPWDGHGMTATQSHGMYFESMPAIRIAQPGRLRSHADAAGPFIACLFTAVIVGIAETALATAIEQLGKRREELKAYDQVELTRAEVEGWLIRQSYEGMLRAVEAGDGALRATLLGKLSVAELAESLTRRLCRIMGGGSFARHSPFGFWFEDVRALGWLRPPWALMFDAAHQSAWG